MTTGWLTIEPQRERDTRTAQGITQIRESDGREGMNLVPLIEVLRQEENRLMMDRFNRNRVEAIKLLPWE